MRNSYLPYNPVFESLTDQANKFIVNHEFIVYEKESTSISAEDVQEYAVNIIGTLRDNVFKFIQTTHYPDLRDATMPDLLEKAPTLSKNSSLDDLVSALNDMWKKSYEKASAHSNKDMIMPFYDKVSSGISEVNKAWEILKKNAGDDKIKDPALLESINKAMETSTNIFLETIKKAKEKLDQEKTKKA
jgi:hypothetical protein